jgi:hypothetical protein
VCLKCLDCFQCVETRAATPLSLCSCRCSPSGPFGSQGIQTRFGTEFSCVGQTVPGTGAPPRVYPFHSRPSRLRLRTRHALFRASFGHRGRRPPEERRRPCFRTKPPFSTVAHTCAACVLRVQAQSASTTSSLSQWGAAKGFPGDGPVPARVSGLTLTTANCATWSSAQEAIRASQLLDHPASGLLLQEHRLQDDQPNTTARRLLMRLGLCSVFTPASAGPQGGPNGGTAIAWPQRLQAIALPLSPNEPPPCASLTTAILTASLSLRVGTPATVTTLTGCSTGRRTRAYMTNRAASLAATSTFRRPKCTSGSKHISPPGASTRLVLPVSWQAAPHRALTIT